MDDNNDLEKFKELEVSNDSQNTEDLSNTQDTENYQINNDETLEDLNNNGIDVDNNITKSNNSNSEIINPILSNKELTDNTTDVNTSGNNMNNDNIGDDNIENNVDNSNTNDLNYNNYKEKKPFLSKKKVIIFLIIIVVLLFFLTLSTIFALLNMNKTTIISGTFIQNINVSGLSKEQAYNEVKQNLETNLSKEITLTYNDFEKAININQFSFEYDIESAVEKAYSNGRSGNIFENNFNIISALISPINIIPNYFMDDNVFNALCTEMESNFSDRLVEPSYYVEGTNLIITKGINGNTIDRNTLKNNIINYINNPSLFSQYIEIPIVYSNASEINIDKIYEEIHKEAKDAYYTTDPYVIYPHVDGVDFNISMAEAKSLLNENKDTYVIPLKITTPNITTNKIGNEAFPHLLGTYSTTYSTANTNRSTNIRLASEKINGTIVMPGELFSYNQIVGQRTASAGFKPAAVYSGGEVTTGIGGGICQVSSTLYNSVLLANLEIVERYNHGFYPGYVPVSRDATVSWGGPDFKFKNTRNYPIKIVCSGTGGTISVKIYGLKSDNEYEVEIQSYVTSWFSYKTITKEDHTLPTGTTKVLQQGSNGCYSVAYKILKQNGEIISKSLLSKDTYNPHNKIVAVGTN